MFSRVMVSALATVLFSIPFVIFTSGSAQGSYAITLDSDDPIGVSSDCVGRDIYGIRYVKSSCIEFTEYGWFIPKDEFYNVKSEHRIPGECFEANPYSANPDEEAGRLIHRENPEACLYPTFKDNSMPERIYIKFME